MLVAEIHGKIVPEAQTSEDYLTSTVFGHLRYLSPDVFWGDLFCNALDCIEKAETLSMYLCNASISVSKYTRLNAYFWPKHASLGEPDLALRFEGGDQQPLNVLIEAKLFAGKSGYGKNDQLDRYARIMDDFRTIGIGADASDHNVLIYLTAKDSLAEINESLALPHAGLRSERIFRMQWQDVLKTCQTCLLSNSIDERDSLVLDDVKRFLIRRRLEYFERFKHHDKLIFQISPQALFSTLFGRVQALETIIPKHGGWTS